ncbi:MAG: demethoxyubiquinone hydroxylase family protein [Acidobacteria bacterium]|nr:demethoxyubiquinone hydroxylase family protein [Acidobacteriota bacterium]MBV9477957.1 demethoxyubiquinone hydroxylase family protein [Acidobacteriota bacterium]
MANAPDPATELVRVLRSACSGELAAGFAYRGHWKSVRRADERERIRTIEAEEWHHRALVRGLLAELGAKPSMRREIAFWCIGRTIGLLCHIGGWFIPMYGAGRLERWNVNEYEDAARLARAAGRESMLEPLLMMAEVEWEHERYFRERITGHRLLRVFRMWPPLPPKERIRAAFAEP